MAAQSQKNYKRCTARNWLAIHAKGLTGRKGAGAHQSKKTYTRKIKHKKGKKL